jgi:hypothetical protein
MNMGKKKRGLENEICIYCNVNPSTRRGDHIPPQCFFKDKRGFPLLQVPCCTECNVKVSNHDQLVRNFVVSLEENSQHPDVTEELHATLARDWDSEGRKQQFISHFVDIESMRESGMNFKPPEQMTEQDYENLEMSLQTDDLLQEFGERIIRALIFKDHGVRITSPFQRKVRTLSQWKMERSFELIGVHESFQKMRKVTAFNSLGGNAFRWITYDRKTQGHCRMLDAVL